MPCSICYQTGHNIRTCTYIEPALISDAISSISYDEFYTHNLDLPSMSDAELLVETPSNLYSSINSFEYPPFEDIFPEVIECMVCYEEIENEKVSLKCGHSYCVQCFIKHMRVGNNCAGCRAHICDPPKKTRANHILSQDEISGIVDRNLINGPDFIESVRSDLLRQTNRHIEASGGDTTEMQRYQMLIIMEQAIKNADINFGFWLAGMSMAQNIIDAVTL